MKTRTLFTRFALLIGATSLLFGCNFGGGNISINPPSSSESSSSSEDSSSSDSSSSVEDSSSDSSSVSSSSTLPVISLEDGDVMIESMKFKNEFYKVNAGKSVLISPNVLPINATYQDFYWESENTEVATVNQRGYVHGESSGESYVTAYALDGSGLTATTKIVVYETEITSISLSIDNKNCSVGETFTIGTTITPSNASVKNLNWKSEDETIASVNSEGTVTCLKEGTTKIRATSPTNTNIYAECVIKVSTIELKNFGLTKSRIYLHLGEEEIIEGKFYPTNASNRNLSFRSSDNSVATVNQNGNVVAKGVGTCNILVTSAALDRDEVCVVEVYEKSANLKTTLSYTYKDYVSNCVFQESCTPSNGDVKALIVPVWFSNSNNFIDVDKRETVRTDIESGFFGSNETVGWRSVRSFYREESRGRFYLDGFVTKWFDCGIKYETFKTNAESTLGLVDVATEWIIRSYPELDLNEYDSDCDGYIDVFVLVYAAPDYTALRDWNSQNLWAYCSWRQNKPGVNQPVVNSYMWASYDFMYGRNISRGKTGHDYGSGHTQITPIDTHTFIHEFGHLLGLSDYYDYSGQYSPGGAFSMQDNNVGGHDPYSLMALGWVDPYIPKKDTRINIKPFAESGDLILLTGDSGFNEYNSPFDEYILVELFTPTGVNKRDADPSTSEYYFDANFVGIRMWHVDARLVVGTTRTIQSSRNFTSNPLTSEGNVYHMVSNTYYDGNNATSNSSILGSAYSDYNMLQLLRNRTDVSHRCQDRFNAGDIFKTGDVFTINKYKKQFKNTELFNNGDEFPWSITFEKVGGTEASIVVEKDS